MEVFYTSPWVPPEWIKAHGLEPRGIWLARDWAGEPLPLAAGVCAFANAATRLAARENNAAVVFTTHCDQLRRGFDALPQGASSRAFLFNLPVTGQTLVAQRIFRDELQRLGRFLIRLGGRAPRARDLIEIVEEYSRARSRLLEAAAWCPARRYAEAVARFHLDGSVLLPADGGCPPPAEIQSAAPITQTPIALVGGPLHESMMPLLNAIESAGGRVVLNATEAGERSLWPAFRPGPTQATSGERSAYAAAASCDRPTHAGPLPFTTGASSTVSHALLTQLAHGWLRACIDVYQRPNTPLYDWLRPRLTARRVRGIVLWHYVGCDLWRAEAQPLREAFGLPVLLLEADQTAPQRNVGRLEAFLESLR